MRFWCAVASNSATYNKHRERYVSESYRRKRIFVCHVDPKRPRHLSRFVKFRRGDNIVFINVNLRSSTNYSRPGRTFAPAKIVSTVASLAKLKCAPVRVNNICTRRSGVKVRHDQLALIISSPSRRKQRGLILKEAEIVPDVNRLPKSANRPASDIKGNEAFENL